ncbi:hypothetical protein SDC9_156828 [bioreactor metagenome]|uniref:DUF2185 domain-containing protein n=1 Tax=bioreactor metagenome TaxID=1076179 RepID=A0A645F5S4_9ZZZZ|nr:hypothetical protein [Paludibacter sp.]
MNKKFLDNLNTAVFTTKYILEKNSSILYVFHYQDDGAWSFSGVEDCQDEDYRVISLEEMISIDNSILDLVDMPYGYRAKRADKNSPWVIESFEE